MTCANGRPDLPSVAESADWLDRWLKSDGCADSIDVPARAGLWTYALEPGDLDDLRQLAHERLHWERGSLYWTRCLREPCIGW